MNQHIDEELQDLAQLVLVNAFAVEFAGLVNGYLYTGDGLDRDLMTIQLAEKANVFGRVNNTPVISFPKLSAVLADGTWVSSDTILEALRNPEAVGVVLNGKEVFTLIEGEWCIRE